MSAELVDLVLWTHIIDPDRVRAQAQSKDDSRAYGSIYVMSVGGRIDNHVTTSRTRNQAK
jgi:hypothetical protein